MSGVLFFVCCVRVLVCVKKDRPTWKGGSLSGDEEPLVHEKEHHLLIGCVSFGGGEGRGCVWCCCSPLIHIVVC